MKLPCEICIWKLLPMIKKELVLNLYHNKKIKQAEIARMLNMSKAAISHYIKGKRGITKIKSNNKANTIIESMTRKLVKGISYKDLKKDFCRICKLLQKEVIHEKIC